MLFASKVRSIYKAASSNVFINMYGSGQIVCFYHDDHQSWKCALLISDENINISKCKQTNNWLYRYIWWCLLRLVYKYIWWSLWMAYMFDECNSIIIIHIGRVIWVWVEKILKSKGILNQAISPQIVYKWKTTNGRKNNLFELYLLLLCINRELSCFWGRHKSKDEQNGINGFGLTVTLNCCWITK